MSIELEARLPMAVLAIGVCILSVSGRMSGLEVSIPGG